MIDVPNEFARRIVAREGAAGRRWIEDLPRLVDGCLERWRLTAEGPPRHGFVGVAVPVRRADGSPAMLKVGWLDDETRWQAAVLAAWAGRGAVRLLGRDDERGAMLVERLDGERSLRELDGVAAAEVAGLVCRRLAVPVPPELADLPRVRDVAARLVDELPAGWERLGRPFARRHVELAAATCRELGPGQPDLLLHGDLVFDNVLRGEREPWLAIDPTGLAGEPAYDASQLLTNRWSELTAQADLRAAVHARLGAFAGGAGVDVERARRWSHVRAVQDAVWCRDHQPDVVPVVDTLMDLLA